MTFVSKQCTQHQCSNTNKWMTSMSNPHKPLKNKFHTIIIAQLWPMKFLMMSIIVIDKIWFLELNVNSYFSKCNSCFQILWIVNFLELWLRLWITHFLSKWCFICFYSHVYVKKKMVTSMEKLIIAFRHMQQKNQPFYEFIVHLQSIQTLTLLGCVHPTPPHAK
jgi:hypothetical protein